MRSRVALAVTVVAVAVIAAIVAVAGGAGSESPATGAAALVPGDALAYVHVSTDSKRPPVKAALALMQRFPTFPLIAAGVVARLSAIVGGGGQVDFSHDIRPWLGKEVALALLNTPTSAAGSELVLAVADEAAARAFVTRVGAVFDGAYRRVSLYRYPSGAELAFVRHYLVLGQEASVRAAVDVAAGKTPSLLRNPGYRRASAGEPADRVLDAYASAGGLQRLLAPQRGLIGALATLLYQPDLAASTISVSAVRGYAKIHVHSALDRALARLSPAHTFTPTLPGLLPGGSLLLFDSARFDQVVPHVLSAAAVGGIGGQVGPLLRRLGAALAAEGVNVKVIDSLFAGETALAISADRRLILVTRTSHELATRTELANLAIPLSQLFASPASGSGQIPQFTDHAVDGVTVHQQTLTPGLEFDYAVFSGLVVLSTSAQGIVEVAKRGSPLGSEPAFRQTLSGPPNHLTSLVFLDFSQLLNLAEQTGLLRGARYRALQPDIERIRAAGLGSTSGEADSTAELVLKIS